MLITAQRHVRPLIGTSTKTIAKYGGSGKLLKIGTTCLIIVAVAVGSRVGCKDKGESIFASFTHVIINYYYSEQHGYDHDNLIE